jgi:hypothetical protein
MIRVVPLPTLVRPMTVATRAQGAVWTLVEFTGNDKSSLLRAILACQNRKVKRGISPVRGMVKRF